MSVTYFCFAEFSENSLHNVLLFIFLLYQRWVSFIFQLWKTEISGSIYPRRPRGLSQELYFLFPVSMKRCLPSKGPKTDKRDHPWHLAGCLHPCVVLGFKLWNKLLTWKWAGFLRGLGMGGCGLLVSAASSNKSVPTEWGERDRRTVL